MGSPPLRNGRLLRVTVASSQRSPPPRNNANPNAANPKPKLDNHWEHWGRVNCKRSRCAVSVQRRVIGLEVRTAPWFHKNINVERLTGHFIHVQAPGSQ